MVFIISVLWIRSSDPVCFGMLWKNLTYDKQFNFDFLGDYDDGGGDDYDYDDGGMDFGGGMDFWMTSSTPRIDWIWKMQFITFKILFWALWTFYCNKLCPVKLTLSCEI